MDFKHIKTFIIKMVRIYVDVLDQSFEAKFWAFGFYPLLALLWTLVDQCSSSVLEFQSLIDPEMKYFWSLFIHSILYSSVIFCMAQWDKDMWTTTDTAILNVKNALDLTVNLGLACVVGIALGVLPSTYDNVPWTFDGILSVLMSYLFVIGFTWWNVHVPLYGLNLWYKPSI